MSRPTSSDYVAAIADQLAPIGRIASGRFFGGYGLKADGVQFAMIIDSTLYLKADAGLAAEMEGRGARPFRYKTKRGTVEVRSYWSAPDETLDDEEALQALARRSILAAGRERPAKRAGAGTTGKRVVATKRKTGIGTSRRRTR